MRKAVNFTVSEGVAGYARVGEGVEGIVGASDPNIRDTEFINFYFLIPLDYF